ncbi:MAG: diaminopimelate epimerase [Clostridiales bacterium]|nr:diaminopimelate epimerase [Clostridiales bacterium]
MKYAFTKMQGCGNDYIYIDAKKFAIDDPAALSVKISDRHFGIGSDGLILVAPSEVADARMIMFNLDGSEGKMCGNGIRCVGKFVHDIWKENKETLTIETKSGIKTLKMQESESGEAVGATVDMGKAILSPQLIPVDLEGDTVIDREVQIDGQSYNITCVSMGNPHAVLFVKDVEHLDLATIGPKFEHHPMFPESVNTEFVEVLGPGLLRMRVWERGSGETWACGTGTCASVVAACLNGYAKKGEDVRVILNGGELVINYTDERVLMTGPAVISFTGEIEV